MLKDFIRSIFGLQENEPVPAIAVWVVLGALIFIGIMLSFAL